MNRNAAELMQYLFSVGGGPSSKTCPRWESPFLLRTSVRKNFFGLRFRRYFLAQRLVKLGQPVPESNLSMEQERFPGDDINVDPSLFIVPVLVFKRLFGTLLLGDFVLQGRQLLAEFCITGLGIFLVARRVSRGVGLALAPDLLQKLIPPGIPAVILVPDRILLRVMLVVVLGRVKPGKFNDLRDNGLP